MAWYSCPKCLDEVMRLRYKTDGYEYGDVLINNNGQLHNWNNDGFEETDGTTYECPECNEEINLDNIELVDDDEDNEHHDHVIPIPISLMNNKQWEVQ